MYEKPDTEETGKLEEARSAAESAKTPELVERMARAAASGKQKADVRRKSLTARIDSRSYQ